MSTSAWLGLLQWLMGAVGLAVLLLGILVALDWRGKAGRATVSIPKGWKPIHGNAYPVREELKRLGAPFDRGTGLWWVPPEKRGEAETLAEEYRSQMRRRR